MPKLIDRAVLDQLTTEFKILRTKNVRLSQELRLAESIIKKLRKQNMEYRKALKSLGAK